MQIFLTTLALFGGAMVAHLLIWKTRLPHRQMKALLIIFVLTYLIWLGISLGHQNSLLTLLHVTLYYWSVSLCYTITYSAIEADSPTLSLMRYVAEAGPAGRSAEDVGRFMEDRPFIGARLVALLKSGLVAEEGGRYVACGAQPLAFRLIFLFRKLYGAIPKGG